MSDSESRSTDLLAFLEPLLRECAQRFGNASMSKLSEKTAAEMMHKCGDALRKVEEANAEAHGRRSRTVQPLVGAPDAEVTHGCV